MEDATVLTSPRRLSPGSNIAWYEVRDVLGVSALGITYRAYDTKRKRNVAIREYLPSFCSQRDENNLVSAISNDQEREFNLGYVNFLNVAKTLGRLNHRSIIKVNRIFKQYNTAYMVMDYEIGDSLDSVVKQQGPLKQNHQAQIFYPIFEGLKKFHELGFIHGRITPSNILIRENGTPVLINFGYARQLSLPQTIYSLTPVSQGYMPPEQYSTEYGEQGSWTDIYSIAASMYQSVTGSKPDDAWSRSDNKLKNQLDTIENLSTDGYPDYHQKFLGALNAGLNLQPELRPQTLNSWQAMLESGFKNHETEHADTRNNSVDNLASTPPNELNNTKETPEDTEQTNTTELQNYSLIFALASLLAMAGLIGFLYQDNQNSRQQPVNDNTYVAMVNTFEQKDVSQDSLEIITLRPKTDEKINQQLNAELITQIVPEVMPEVMPEVIPEVTPEVMPEVIPEVIPEVTPVITPEAMPETAPEATPAEATEQIIEEVAQVTPETSTVVAPAVSTSPNTEPVQDATQDSAVIAMQNNPAPTAQVPTIDISREQCSNRLEVLSRTGEIYFKSGGVRLEETSFALLSAVIDVTELCPQFNLEVSGHTDAIGNDANNQRLSELRAQNVATYLTNNGIDASRVTTKGYGETRPIAVNNTASNRAKNRRIEFTIVN